MRILIVLLTFLTSIATGQNFSISCDIVMNTIYLERDNPLNAVLENKPCGSFFLTTDNGKITGDSCKFVIRPERRGRAKVFVKQKIGNDTIVIGKVEFKVKDVVLKIYPYLCNNKSEGKITKKELKNAIGIFTGFEDFVCIEGIRVDVTSFSVIILRKDIPIYTEEIKGFLLSDGLKKAIENIKKDDQIIFLNIIAKSPNSDHERLYPMSFIVE
jgi:hypothetical protein